MSDRSEILKRIKETLQRVAPEAQSIVTLSVKEEQQITIPLYEIEIETGVPISPMIVLKKNWEKRPFKTPFQIDILNEGIAL